MSEREKRNRNKGAADFLFQLTENRHVSQRDTNPSLLNWKSTGEMRHTFDDGASQMSSAELIQSQYQPTEKCLKMGKAHIYAVSQFPVCTSHVI